MTQIDAFRAALVLAIEAETQEQVDKAVALAEQIAATLTPDEVAIVKVSFEAAAR